jgi:PEP-CTERM motif
MKSMRWIRLTAIASGAVLLVPMSLECRADTTLASWETAANGTVHVGDDFDPQLDNTLSCSGCWYSKQSYDAYSQSTIGATAGTHSLKVNLVGKGLGGSYSYPINGSPVNLQTHFDNPMSVTYSNTTNAAAGGPDPRFAAIDAAVKGNQNLYTVDFDVTYDIASMRAIPWQPPIETVNPDPNGGGAYPQRFFWFSMGAQSNNSFNWVAFDTNSVNPFDAKWDNNLFPTFHTSFPLTAFGYAGANNSTFYTMSFLYNSVFGSTPASSNTSGVNIYVDNLKLRFDDPVLHIDYNNDHQATPADWNLFMSQYLSSSPVVPPNPATTYDLVGNFGAIGTNGKVDFADLQKFQSYYAAAHPGAGASSFPWAGSSVPEPGSLALAAMALVGLIASRARKLAKPMVAAAIGIIVLLAHQSAQAQLIEGFETIGKWGAFSGSDPNAGTITVATSTNVEAATEGTHSLKITQGQDNAAVFTWNAATNPNWTTGDTAWNLLSHAVRVGAENYNLLVDSTFVPADLADVSSLQMSIGLNFNSQNIGLYSGEATTVKTTTTIPLANFNLPDAIDQGATSYSAEISFTGNKAASGPYSAYVDNIRLVQVTQPDLLTLQVDRSTGAGVLKNLSANPISWNLLDVTSAGGALNASGWSSLADQNADGAGTWVEAGGSSATELAEASLSGSHTLAPGGTFPIGNVLNNSNHSEDLGFVIRKAAGPTNRTYDQNVIYINNYPTPAGVPGDYNNNGFVDAADYTVWRDHLGQTFTLPNRDGTASGAINQADYTFWKTHFGNHAGAGAEVGGAVPEPSTFVLCLIGFVTVGLCRRTKSSCA